MLVVGAICSSRMDMHSQALQSCCLPAWHTALACGAVCTYALEECVGSKPSYLEICMVGVHAQQSFRWLAALPAIHLGLFNSTPPTRKRATYCVLRSLCWMCATSLRQHVGSSCVAYSTANGVCVCCALMHKSCEPSLQLWCACV
jgi:hypothetical protein